MVQSRPKIGEPYASQPAPPPRTAVTLRVVQRPEQIADPDQVDRARHRPGTCHAYRPLPRNCRPAAAPRRICRSPRILEAPAGEVHMPHHRVAHRPCPSPRGRGCSSSVHRDLGTLEQLLQRSPGIHHACVEAPRNRRSGCNACTTGTECSREIGRLVHVVTVLFSPRCGRSACRSPVSAAPRRMLTPLPAGICRSASCICLYDAGRRDSTCGSSAQEGHAAGRFEGRAEAQRASALQVLKSRGIAGTRDTSCNSATRCATCSTRACAVVPVATAAGKGTSHRHRTAPHCTALQPHCNRTATALQPHCNRTATALQPHCNRTATALQPHCNRTATALQPHCFSGLTSHIGRATHAVPL